MAELTNEFFSLRNAETFQIHDQPPASLAARVLAVMVRSVAFAVDTLLSTDCIGSY